jgi:DNA-binding HxlR family transcriptional regulator
LQGDGEEEASEEGSPVRGGVDEAFLEFGDASTEFVRRISAREAIGRRRDPAAVEANVGLTKKVFSKWSVEIILSIYSLKAAGFGELKRLLRPISSQVLSKKLRELEGLGLLEREVVARRPTKVRYALSAKGELLAKLGEPVILYLRSSVADGRD